MIINKSFYNDFELVLFELVKESLQPYKNDHMAFELVGETGDDEEYAVTILKEAIKKASEKTGHDADSIGVGYIETGYNYPGENQIVTTEECFNIDWLKYRKYAITSGYANLFSGDNIICIVTLIFSNGYYLGFNMKRKVTKWEDITSDTIKEIVKSQQSAIRNMII